VCDAHAGWQGTRHTRAPRETADFGGRNRPLFVTSDYLAGHFRTRLRAYAPLHAEGISRRAGTFGWKFSSDVSYRGGDARRFARLAARGAGKMDHTRGRRRDDRRASSENAGCRSCMFSLSADEEAAPAWGEIESREVTMKRERVESTSARIYPP